MSSVDKVYMKVAILMKELSKDPHLQVGACIVDPRKNVIVSSGSNHFPDGCENEFSWTKGASGLQNYQLYVVHAEANAISRRRSDIEGCVLYSTMFPCNECAKQIIQSKISKVFYIKTKEDEIHYQASLKLLEAAGIPCIQINF